MIGAVACILTGAMQLAAAQGYPTRAITIVVPFPPGGGSDVVARLVAEPIGRHLGQNVIIENVAGAGGTTGTTRVAQAAPDGYTMVLAHTGTHAAAPPLYPSLRYHPLKDFSPIGLINTNPIVVVARKSMEAQNLKQVIAYLRANPKATNAHAGIGSVSHTTCLHFNALTDLKTTSVGYRGAAPAMNDVVAGHVDYMCDQISTVLPQVRAGTIKAYAIGQATRSPLLPDVPTTAEAGLPEFQSMIWNALLFPRGVPEPIVQRMNEALRASLDLPAVRKRFEDNGGELPTAEQRTPEGLRAFIEKELAHWTAIIRKAGVTAE
jgi:tripartite-type tricarboxylate transporter receptor subunit TctC